ncbi:MAG TPA: PEGA domain-containing protein [Kofleriaceae bacterium]|nr:PEGA domain-containing protein [Kofleriaceae bacterium]
MRHVIAHALLVVLALAAPAAAQPQGQAPPGPGAPAVPPPAAGRKVALAPLTTLGEEAKNKAMKAIEKAIAEALRAVPGVQTIDADEVAREIKKSKRVELRACDGDVACLADLGQLVGASQVVFGEVGGLGDAQVAYLKLVDVDKKTEVRSTTMEVATYVELKGVAHGAAIRLLDPDRYVGRLVCKVDVDGATIYVNGARRSRSPAKPIVLPVGTHALRISHPEFRDFVRFVDIGFDKDVVVEAPMQQYPIIQKDIVHREGKPGGTQVIYRGQEETPWYRRWYTVAGGGALVFIGTAVLVGVLADGIDADGEKIVDGP